ncbi:UDP-N-acetylmuramyl pentapeptide phosphotransferase/UDP-N-acetylglucosamine-1-phosphate transferase [Maribacter orientalis]|uniref:UDP-N-acetylmuramyl pentapeptide phosphotransferase/UDP-N-acetylglucosamine-1-phosphate transferase n=1 Tax=Maribacter orientalis TaxID=228957 RepID=A0A1H7N7V3_9FLAO|nr:MraY family glycosyltransferase [Maribacter orientalis]SEL19574.1 UDP-N-acetylmuramyl pentapeptide phosphotransferase/UDP-N-acetylglucosamine-1-phosphate transferase [Maribacter orientalis]
MNFLTTIFSNEYLLAIFAVVGTYVFSIRLFPVLIYLSHKKNLMDEPVERSSHTQKTPTLGGVGIFISFSLVLILFGIFSDFIREDLIRLLTVIGASILLLFLGLKDDLLVISPRKKFIGQLVASLLVILATDVRIISMEGILGVYTLPYILSVIFTLFVFVLIINAYNLIDGIDGLAGGIAVMVCGFFGVYFMLNNYVFMSLVSFALIGAQCGFLEHNLSKKQKLFMGDSGSLFTGFLLAYLVVVFLNFNLTTGTEFRLDNAPILALAIVSYPLFDTLRVFSVRMYQGKSPFDADRNHIHHRWLSKGLPHRAASFVIVLTSILVIVFAVMLKSFNMNVQLVVCVALGVGCYLSPFIISYQRFTKNSMSQKKGQRILAVSSNEEHTDQEDNWSDATFDEEKKLYEEIKQRKMKEGKTAR